MGVCKKKSKENMKIFVAIPMKLRPTERKKGEIFYVVTHFIIKM